MGDIVINCVYGASLKTKESLRILYLEIIAKLLNQFIFLQQLLPASEENKYIDEEAKMFLKVKINYHN